MSDNVDTYYAINPMIFGWGLFGWMSRVFTLEK